MNFPDLLTYLFFLFPICFVCYGLWILKLDKERHESNRFFFELMQKCHDDNVTQIKTLTEKNKKLENEINILRKKLRTQIIKDKNPRIIGSKKWKKY